jgi:hypothetical protein
MDANHFSKLCRDCSLVDASLSDIMVDLVYLKVGAQPDGYITLPRATHRRFRFILLDK